MRGPVDTVATEMPPRWRVLVASATAVLQVVAALTRKGFLKHPIYPALFPSQSAQAAREVPLRLVMGIMAVQVVIAVLAVTWLRMVPVLAAQVAER